MYLAAYHFEGDIDALLAAYHRMMAGFPADAISLHVAVRGREGLTVYDACPDEATFRAFSTSPEFRESLTAAGLPAPHIEPLGETESILVGEVRT